MPGKYTISVSMDVRTFGVVLVEAQTVREAAAMVDHAYVEKNFEPNGNGRHDIDYSCPMNVFLNTATSDDETVKDIDEDDGEYNIDRYLPGDLEESGSGVASRNIMTALHNLIRGLESDPDHIRRFKEYMEEEIAYIAAHRINQ